MSSIRLHSRLLLGQPSVLLQAKKQVLHPRRNLQHPPPPPNPLNPLNPRCSNISTAFKKHFQTFSYVNLFTKRTTFFLGEGAVRWAAGGGGGGVTSGTTRSRRRRRGCGAAEQKLIYARVMVKIN